MEVHTHSHTPRKKWTHYFWEFFMLFLAVTAGFFVENRREHYIEHQRAKVYAKAMLANLQSDTSELKTIITHGEFAKNYLDSFLIMMAADHPYNIPTGKLYFFGLWGGYLRGFEPNDATFQQMRNSGSLRYFNDSHLEQLIGEYDQVIRQLRRLQDIDQAIFLETRKARAGIFDFRYNNAANKVVQQYVYRNFNQAAIDSFINTNPALLTQDRLLLNEYAELCRSRTLNQQLTNSKMAFGFATEIILALEEKFHLK